MGVPWWVMVPYGLIEKMVIFFFICKMTGTPITRTGLVAASALALAVNLAFRAMLPINLFIWYYIMIIANIAVVALLLRFFTGNGRLMVWIVTVIAFTVLFVVEYPVAMIGELHLKDLVSYNLLWVITGIPQIVVLLALAILSGKVRSARDKVSV
jgi:hypothetical protein